MKKENILFFLFPLIWAFYFFFMEGHILHEEGTNFFLRDPYFSGQFILKPGGWSEYISYFFLQFFRWTWLGALILTFIPLGIWWFCKGILLQFKVPGYGLILSSLPFIVVSGLLCCAEIPFYEIVRIFLFFLFLWGFLKIPVNGIRLILFTLLLPVVYLSLSAGGGIALYGTFFLYEIRKKEYKYNWSIALVWILVMVILPFIWKKWIFIIPADSLFIMTNLPEGNGKNGLLSSIYFYGIFLLLMTWILKRRILKTNQRVFIFHLLVIVFALVGNFYVFYQQRLEKFFQMDQAIQTADWDKVLQLGKTIDRPDREEFYFISLALACKGELGDRLFDYPVNGIGCLYLPRDLDYQTSVLGGELYYRLKVPNEAIHWTFQASVASPLGADFRTLMRLVDLNILKGDKPLAQKYLTILEKTSCYASWCAERRQKLEAPACVPPQEKMDFFIGGRPFLSDMARLLDAGRSEKMVLDYILCGLLLDKDLPKFCQLFIGFYPYKEGDRIPKAYEEALLMAASLGWKNVREKNYRFSAESVQKHSEYNILMNTYGNDKAQAKIRMEAFKNTWWYYLHFIQPVFMDQKGHILNIYSS